LESFVKNGLRDLSISRASFNWGQRLNLSSKLKPLGVDYNLASSVANYYYREKFNEAYRSVTPKKPSSASSHRTWPLVSRISTPWLRSDRDLVQVLHVVLVLCLPAWP
jgi:hypothetical protein